MSEVVNAIVAFAVIVIIFRWATSSSDHSNTRRSASSTLGFRPKNVTQEMVDQIHSMFPTIPQDNIRYDLLRTGSVEITSNKILERGYLDAPPPAYFTVYPRTEAPPQARQVPQGQTTGLAPTPKENLIARYKLQDRVTTSTLSPDDDLAFGKANWEDTSEKREASLQERKAQMILAARQRLLAQQAQKEEAGGASSSSSH
ncbi:uncharacterized protein EDB91DRAFT_1147797 [Suillus paluster]|uniref:uncharacterized protein n=1 Tax=Suillus paluster TaxID=48578 RepID=UPI001B86AE51|nr:uncharacterized protein EDB91DRAFT_1147797 [Suillus paluster]KAG1733885.1 hypothetical protein EDB91DRAFT_1147797 [Suillus paluster]